MAMLVPENYSRTNSGSIFKSKNSLQKRKRNSNGVLSEDLKSIKRPKKLQAGRQKKIENAVQKNDYDAAKYTQAILSNLWESYTKDKVNGKEITFRLFESKMKQTKFRNTILERYQ